MKFNQTESAFIIRRSFRAVVLKLHFRDPRVATDHLRY